jgi:hypothetical protein
VVGHPRRKESHESPLIQEIGEEFHRAGQVKFILYQLKERFGPVGPDIPAGLARLTEEKKLLRLSLHAMTCKTLQAFADRLREQLPPQAQASTRGKRRSRKSSV